jgi:hypothetical protein
MTLSARERNLAMVVGGVVFVLLNLVLIKAFAGRNVALKTQLTESRSDWTQMQELLGAQDLWAARDAALTAKQQKLTNENHAGVELLEMIHAVAQRHDVALENTVFAGVEKTQWARSVPVTMDTHSSWPNLVAFLYAVQKPDQFIVFESANIQVDPADQTKMLGHFKIARWYARD